MRVMLKGESGFTLLEVLVSVALIAVLMTVMMTNINTLENPLISSSSNLSHYFRLVRVRAIAQTRSILITPQSSRTLGAASAKNCDEETFTTMDDSSFELDPGVTLSSTDWEICFTQRGLVQQAVTFDITADNGTRTVEVALGGGVRIQ